MATPAPKPSIDTCHACRKLFPRVSIRLCTSCALVEEHRFALVREFVLEHDGAAVGEIATGTGVAAIEVRRFLESGRLVELAVNPHTTCTCGGVGERCRFCRRQLSTVFRDMETTMQREQSDRTGQARERVHYVKRIRRLGSDAA